MTTIEDYNILLKRKMEVGKDALVISVGMVRLLDVMAVEFYGVGLEGNGKKSNILMQDDLLY